MKRMTAKAAERRGKRMGIADMSRAEHLAWCKKRALQYLEPGPYYSLRDAYASMCSDISKHEGTSAGQETIMALGMAELMKGEDEGAIRRWINGFN